MLEKFFRMFHNLQQVFKKNATLASSDFHHRGIAS